MIKAVIFDLDGTLYRGQKALDGAIEALDQIRASGKQVLFLTNSATKSRIGVASKLLDMGFETKASETYPGSYLLSRYVVQNYPKKKVFIIGERGLYEEVENAGIIIDEEKPDLVLVGLDRKFNYEKLARAHLAISNGASLVVSNLDNTYPIEKGTLPGCGSIVAAIEYATGRKAYSVGKPNPFPLELIKKEYVVEPNEILVVGDRIDTDVLFAKNCGAKSALVLSGNTKESDIKNIKPDFVLNSVATLQLNLL